MNRTTKAIKTGAAALALQVFLTNCLLANTAERSFYEERSQKIAKTAMLASLPASLPVIQASLPASSPSVHFQPSAGFTALDASFGNVRSIESNPSSKQSVVYIQDVHGNEEAQRHIAGAVAALIDQNNADVVVLEGAAGDIDLKAFRSCPWPDSARRAADGLLADGKISGAIFGAVLARREVPVVGAEQPSLYDQNVDAVRRAQAALPSARKALSARRAAIEDAKAQTYSPALLAFDRTVVGHRGGTVSIGHYAEAITAEQKVLSPDLSAFREAVRIEEGMDSKATERERSALLTLLAPKLTESDTRGLIEAGINFRAGKTRAADFYKHLSDICSRSGVPLTKYPAMSQYVRYVLLADSINMDRVTVELDGLERARFEKLAVSDAERKLVADDAALQLQNNLVEFSLNSDEWSRYRALSGRDPVLEPFEAFYKSAELRNAAIAGHLLAAMKVHGPKAILVTGGFHSKNVSREILARATVSTFVPRITNANTESTAQALSVFTQEKTPLDRLFAGERLFLAQNPAPHESLVTASLNGPVAAFRSNEATAAEAIAALERAGRDVTSLENLDTHVAVGMASEDTAEDLLVPFDQSNRPRSPVLSRIAKKVKSFALNSTWSLGVIVAVTTIVIFSHFIDISQSQYPAIYAMAKIFIFWFTLWHERAQLVADGQMKGLRGNEAFRLLSNVFLRSKNIQKMSVFAILNGVGKKVVGGRDVMDAAVQAKARSRDSVVRVAEAGRKANIRQALYGIGIFILGAAGMTSGISHYAVLVAMFGFMWLMVNAILIYLNRWSTDADARRTGRPQLIYQAIGGDVVDLDADFNREAVINNSTTDPAAVLKETVKPFLSNIESDLGGITPDQFQDAASDVIRPTITKAFLNGSPNVHLRASIDGGDLMISIAMESIPLTDEQARAIITSFNEQWTNRDWSLTVSADRRTVSLRTPLNIPVGIDDLPMNGAVMNRYIGALTKTRAIQARAAITAEILTPKNQPEHFLPDERLVSFLWLDNEDVFARVLQRVVGAPSLHDAQAFIDELKKIVASDQLPHVRRRAEWALSMLESLMAANPSNDGWNYGRISGKSLPSNRNIRLKVMQPGTIDMFIEAPVGYSGKILSLIKIFGYPRKTVARIRLTTPGIATSADGATDTRGLKTVQLSFPDPENEPTPDMFKDATHTWAELVAPIGTILLIDQKTKETIDAQSSAWLNEIVSGTGFDLTNARPGDGVALLKTKRAGDPTVDNTPLNGVLRFFWVIIRAVLFLPFNFINVLDEGAHRVAFRIEGRIDISQYPLWAILIGIGEPTSDSKPRRSARVDAANGGHKVTTGPILWVLTFGLGKQNVRFIAPVLLWAWMVIAFGSAAAICAAGGFDVNVWIFRSLVGGAAVGGILIFLNLILVPRDGFKGSDFWRYVEARKNQKIADKKKPAQKVRSWVTPTLDELEAETDEMERRQQNGEDIHSPLLDLTLAVRALGAKIQTWVHNLYLSWKGLSDLAPAIRRELANGGLSPETTAAIQKRGGSTIRRHLRDLDVEMGEALHRIDWSILSKWIEDDTNPLVGASLRNAEGIPFTDEQLEPYFTKPGFDAYKAYRNGDVSDLFDGALRVQSMGRHQITLAALNPDMVGKFYETIAGKPFAAATARRYNAADTVVLDSSALPWIRGVARYGSVEEDLEDLNGSEQTAYLYRLLAANAPVYAGAYLINRTVGVNKEEKLSMLNAIEAVLNTTHETPAANESDPVKVERSRSLMLRNALLLTKPDESLHAVETDTMNALMKFLSGHGATNGEMQEAQRDTSPMTNTPLRDDLLPAGSGSGSRGGGIPSLMRVQNTNGAESGQDAGTLALATRLPQNPLALNAGNENNISDSNRAGSARFQSAANSRSSARPPNASANARPFNAANAPATAPLSSANQRNQRMSETASAQRSTTRNISPLDSRNGRGNPAKPVSPAKVAEALLESVNSDASSTQGLENAARNAGRDEQTRAAVSNTGNEQTALANANRLDEQARTTGQPTGNTSLPNLTLFEGASNPTRKTDQAGTALSQNSTLAPQTSSALGSLFNGLAARGFDVAGIAVTLAVSASLVALGVQALGIPQTFLPATLFAVLSTTLAFILFTLNQVRVGAFGLANAGTVSGTGVTAGGSAVGAGRSGTSGNSDARPPFTQRVTSSVSSATSFITQALAAVTPRFFLSPAARNARDIDQRIVRAAAISTLDAAAALLAETRGIDYDDAVAILAGRNPNKRDKLTDEDKAVVEALAKATQDAARAAVARTLAAHSAEDRAALGNRDFNRSVSNVGPVLTEIQTLAGEYDGWLREKANSRSGEQRSDDLSGSVSRGRLLLSLKAAWAEQMMAPVNARRPLSVRVLKISSARASQRARLVAPLTAGRPKVNTNGTVDNEDLSGMHASTRRPRGDALSVQLGFPVETSATGQIPGQPSPTKNPLLIAALGISAGKTSEALVLGSEGRGTADNKAEAKGREAGDSSTPGVKTPARVTLFDSALAQQEPGSALVEKILSNLKKPASIAATIAVVVLAGAAVAFGIVEAVVAVLTVTVMLLMALGAQIAKMQKEARDGAQSASATNPNATRTSSLGTLTGNSDSLAPLARLIADFIRGRSQLGTKADIAAFNTLLPTPESIGVGGETNFTEEISALSNTDLTNLARSVSTYLAQGDLKNRPNADEARTWIMALISAEGRKKSIRALAANKNLFYPVRDINLETEAIEALVRNLGPKQSLYLSCAEKDLKSLTDKFKGDERIIPIIQSTDLFEVRKDGRNVINLSKLATDLSSKLKKDAVENLFVLIPSHVGWDAANIERLEILEKVGFILMQDFDQGIKVDRAALRNIGHLVEMISSQA